MVEQGKDKGSTLCVCQEPEILDSGKDENGKRGKDQDDSPHEIETKTEDCATADMTETQAGGERGDRAEERAAHKMLGFGLGRG